MEINPEKQGKQQLGIGKKRNKTQEVFCGIVQTQIKHQKTTIMKEEQ